MNCEACGAEVLDIDVRCGSCNARLSSTGAQRMLGSVVLGQYEMVDILGQGGMAVVYKGVHKLTEQVVALKILPPELAAHSQVKSRFLDEAKALAQLDHANIVHLHNFGQENGCFVLAMQFVEGDTWERMILEEEDVDWPKHSWITLDVLRALEYAHGRGVVHRDMKPSNVLIRADDGTATVMDFGIAKMTTSTKLTATGQTMGTVRYMSPEQVRGLTVDARTDLYSLGATLYEAVVGDTPFDGETHFEIMTKHLNEPPKPPSVYGIDVPRAFEDVLMRALAKKPEDRFQSARDFRKELEKVLADNDMGRAETLRISRSMLAVERPKKPKAQAPQSGPSDVTGLAGKLEPSGEHATTVGDHAPAATTTVSEGRPKLWIGLAALVLVAGAGVAVVLASGGDKTAKGDTAPAASPSDAATAPAWPEAFRPPDLEAQVDQRYAADKLRVLSVNKRDPARVRAAWVEGYERFETFVKKRKMAEALARHPMNILVVPQVVMCDPRVYREQRRAKANAPADCRERSVHYRPSDKTLLVIDDDKEIPANVAFGVGVAVCMHDSKNVKRCTTELGTFDSEVRAAVTEKPDQRPKKPNKRKKR